MAEGQPSGGAQSGGSSPIADGYRTPPCIAFPRRWNFDYGPVLAPVVQFDRVLVPKLHQGRFNSPDSEPCGRNEGHCNDEAKVTGLKEQDLTQEILSPVSKRNHLNGCDEFDGEPAGSSFEGPRKRSSMFISNAEDTTQKLRGDTLCGAFKCIKSRKPVQ
jgi:hypothetical protein